MVTPARALPTSSTRRRKPFHLALPALSIAVWSFTPSSGVFALRNGFATDRRYAVCSARKICGADRVATWDETSSETHRDDIGVAHDGVGEGERDDDLDAEGRDVAVHGDILHRVEEAQVALGRLGRVGGGDCGESGASGVRAQAAAQTAGRTAFLDDIKGGVGDVVVLELVGAGLGEGADEDGVVVRGHEGDCVKAERRRRHGGWRRDAYAFLTAAVADAKTEDSGDPFIVADVLCVRTNRPSYFSV